jgi:hypothetical protein
VRGPKRSGRRVLAACVFILTLLAGACSPACGDGCTRVLFIGNSYTFFNDLPGTFARLAQAGGHPVETGMVAEGGWMLSDALNSPAVRRTLNNDAWDYVVLQEQSEMPAFAWSRSDQMYPAARSLVQLVRDAGATPLFFVTWAHRAGAPENGLPDYASMQAEINQGYYGIGAELGVRRVTVGYYWSVVRATHPEIELWQEDGSHPTPAGTYLAACVFYVALFSRSPVGLNYSAGLSADEALLLQQAAAAP